MIKVSSIWNEIQRVLGTCDEAETYSKLNESVELLANTGLWDPTVGIMDICTDECVITLPDDVEVPLAINVGGAPAQFRNKWYEFHLNGPGSECCRETATWSWTDQGSFPTFRSIHRASVLMATPDLNEGNSCSIRVFGFDDHEKWIMTPDSTGTLVDGFLVPVIYGASVPTTQKVKRITRVEKPVTRGFVKLVALDNGSSAGTLLGYFKPSDTDPEFRRIAISGAGTTRLCGCQSVSTWVRMRFLKKKTIINDQNDLIFLNSPTAIKMGCQAIKKYEADLSGEYQTYLELAKEALEMKQKRISGPNQIKIQFQPRTYGSRTGSNLV